MPTFKNNDDGIKKIADYEISKFGDISKFKIKDNQDISSLFLAGAPGAGKTEFMDKIFNDLKKTFIVIDIDKYRKYFEGYNGSNSSDYQNASVKVADKILKYCFKNNLNFVFDGTFRNYNKVKQNLKQCEKYNRVSLISLIFQEPRVSFYYTFLRKLNKKRNVPIDVFIDGFYCSIFNSFKAIKDFNNVYLMIAEKKYHPLNKEKFKYKVDYKTRSLKKFCKKHMILYENGEFKNKERLKIDLEKFNDILLSQFSNGNKSILGKIKIWFLDKFNKIP